MAPAPSWSSARPATSARGWCRRCSRPGTRWWRRPPGRPTRAAYEWGHAVEWRRCDATDPDQVARALEGVDALCYLVHSLDGPQFADRDRLAARTTAEAVAASDVRRVVYLSGLVPDPSGRPLSDHLASRHEVEGLLATSGRSTLALRAGVVIGAGSTSFEIVRQLATLLVVQPVPLWMHRQVQPVAVSDMVRALVEAVADEEPTGSLDVGGPDVLSYPALLAHVQPLRGPGAAAGAGADGPQHAPWAWAWPRSRPRRRARRWPWPTACATTWSAARTGPGCPPTASPLLDAETAIRRALAGDPADPESPRAGDAGWTRRLPLVESVPSPASVRAAGALAVRRLREAAGRARRTLGEADRSRPGS